MNLHPKQAKLLLNEKQNKVLKSNDLSDKQQRDFGSFQGQQQPVKTIPFHLFKHFLLQSQTQPSEQYLILKVNETTIKNKLPIWASTNVEISHQMNIFSSPTWGVPLIQKHRTQEDNFNKNYGSKLVKYALELQDNIDECQSCIQNLEELKDLQRLEKDQPKIVFQSVKEAITFPEIHLLASSAQDLKKIEDLKERVQELQKELKKLSVANSRLREKIAVLNEAQESYLQTIKSMQDDNASKLSASPLTQKSHDSTKKAKRKVYLINY